MIPSLCSAFNMYYKGPCPDVKGKRALMGRERL